MSSEAAAGDDVVDVRMIKQLPGSDVTLKDARIAVCNDSDVTVSCTIQNSLSGTAIGPMNGKLAT